MHEHTRALHMAQKTMAKSRAFCSAFNQPRHIGDDKAAASIDAHHAEIWFERREMVVGDLWLGSRHAADDRRFADVWKTNEADVCQQLELEGDPALFAFFAVFSESRRAVGGAYKARVAASAAPTLGDDDLLTMMAQIAE